MTMFRILILFLIFSFACKPAAKEAAETTATSQPELQSIFNGRNLDGWTVKINKHPVRVNYGNTFRVEDGILKIRYDEYGDDFDERFGAIYYNKRLKNYHLKLDYRFVGETAPGAPEWGFRDSGVQLHCQSPESLKIDQPFPVSMEYNLHGGDGTNDRPVGAICANGMKVKIDGEINSSYCTPAKIGKTYHGDQWVSIEIDVKDGVIKHYSNGEEIMSYTDPIFDADHDLGKQFIKDGNAIVSGGYISFQSNSHPIDFRNIELMEY